MIDTLMIFAAGFGKRMQPITNHIPKPLVEVAGKPMLYHALDLAGHFPFKKIIINAHHLAHLIEAAVKRYIYLFKPSAQIDVIFEGQILETGGGIKNAYHLFGQKDAIFSINSDSIITTSSYIWCDMLASWRYEAMDFLMLVTPRSRSFGSIGKGDFNLNAQGRLSRQKEGEQFDFMFNGLQIIKPNLIVQNSDDVFSLSSYYKDPAIKLHGFVNPGNFYHISNIADWQNLQDLPNS